MSAWPEKRGKYWRVRYHRDDGSIGSLSDRYTKTEAKSVADEINSQQRKGIFIDPARGDIKLGEFAEEWFAGLRKADETVAQLRSVYRTWVAPRWGDVALNEINFLALHRWLTAIADQRSQSMVVRARLIMRKILDFAVWDKRLAQNPLRVAAPQDMPKSDAEPAEKPWPMPIDVVRIAHNAYWLAGTPEHGFRMFVAIVTFGWTGGRWGEIAGLRVGECDLDEEPAVLHLADKTLHEVGGKLTWRRGKTAAATRDVQIPAFLADLIRALTTMTSGDVMFTSPEGTPLRRSNFARRVLDPATDGRPARSATRGRAATPAIPPVVPGLTPHGFRHGHNTWLSADIPEVGRKRRMGWQMDDKMQEIYSHVAPDVEAKILRVLTTLWVDAVQDFRKESLARLPAHCRVSISRRGV